MFTKALRKGGGFKLDDLSLIVEEKKQAIRKSEVLDFFDLDEDLDQVGGMEEVKRWVHRRSQAFDDEAARYGLPAPKGLLLIGVQGCGKSLTAKAVAGTFHLPLVRLDLAAVFGSASPESSMRRAIPGGRIAGAGRAVGGRNRKRLCRDGRRRRQLDPRVSAASSPGCRRSRPRSLWWPRPTRSNSCRPSSCAKDDSTRSFSSTCPMCTNVNRSFPYILRNASAIRAAFDLDTLARQSEHFSGAELEQGVLAGMFRAFAGKREVNTRDIQQELDLIVPLYVTYEEKIKSLREWAKTRARRASLDQSLVDLFDKE